MVHRCHERDKTLCDLNESLKSAEDDQGDDDADNDRSNETRNTKALQVQLYPQRSATAVHVVFTLLP